MSAEDVDIDLDYLIALVQERPPLWDKTSEDFSNRFQRANEWAAICKILFPDYDDFDDAKRNRFGNEVVKKWRSVKDNFFRYVKKIKENRESGLPIKKMKKYHYFNQLRFLLKVTHHHHESDGLLQETGHSSTKRTLAIMEPQPSTTTKAPGPSCTIPASFKRARTGLDDIGTEPLGTPEDRENRHMLFFKAIMPSIINFTDLQTLTFQGRVLELITEIRFGQQTQVISSTSAAEHQHQSSNSSRRDTNANCNDDNHGEFDFTVKIEKL